MVIDLKATPRLLGSTISCRPSFVTNCLPEPSVRLENDVLVGRSGVGDHRHWHNVTHEIARMLERSVQYLPWCLYTLLTHLGPMYNIVPYHIMSYHIISYHIISYHIVSYHIISYHVISYSD